MLRISSKLPGQRGADDADQAGRQAALRGEDQVVALRRRSSLHPVGGRDVLGEVEVVDAGRRARPRPPPRFRWNGRHETTASAPPSAAAQRGGVADVEGGGLERQVARAAGRRRRVTVKPDVGQQGGDQLADLAQSDDANGPDHDPPPKWLEL